MEARHWIQEYANYCDIEDNVKLFEIWGAFMSEKKFLFQLLCSFREQTTEPTQQSRKTRVHLETFIDAYALCERGYL